MSMRELSKVTLRIPQAVERGYIECPVWGCFDWSYPSSRLRRARVQEQGRVCGAITRSNIGFVAITAEER